MNWIVKALVQGLFARVPWGEEMNYAAQRFAGARDHSALDGRIDRGIEHLKSIRSHLEIAGRTILEVGTGWDALHTVMLAAMGARKVISVDHVAHLRFAATREVLSRLLPHAASLAEVCDRPPEEIAGRLQNAAEAKTLEDLLQRLNIEYLAPTDTSRLQSADASIDMVYSYLVLSYVPQADLIKMVAEFHRILRPGGISIHRVRLADPFEDCKGGDRMDFLRCPELVWAILCQNKIQYNNRLRACELEEILKQAGGEPVFVDKRVEAGDTERASRLKVAQRFRSISAQELAVTGITIVSRFGLKSPCFQPGPMRQVNESFSALNKA